MKMTTERKETDAASIWPRRAILFAFVCQTINSQTKPFIKFLLAEPMPGAGDILVGCGLRSYLYRNGDLIDLEKTIGDAGLFIDFGLRKDERAGSQHLRV